jgi:hypothetical protein
VLCPPLQAQVWTSNMSRNWRSLGKADARRSGQSHSLVAIFMNWSGQAGAQAARVCMTASTSRSAF